MILHSSVGFAAARSWWRFSSQDCKATHRIHSINLTAKRMYSKLKTYMIVGVLFFYRIKDSTISMQCRTLYMATSPRREHFRGGCTICCSWHRQWRPALCSSFMAWRRMGVLHILERAFQDSLRLEGTPIRRWRALGRGRRICKLATWSHDERGCWICGILLISKIEVMMSFCFRNTRGELLWIKGKCVQILLLLWTNMVFRSALASKLRGNSSIILHSPYFELYL